LTDLIVADRQQSENAENVLLSAISDEGKLYREPDTSYSAY